MNITQFFEDVLGTKLKNVQWSWGSVDTFRNRVFLRLWNHQFDTFGDKQVVEIGWDVPRRKSNGYAERNSHIERILNGAVGFGVVCEATKINPEGAHRIKSFNDQEIAVLGTVLKKDGKTYAEVKGYIPSNELLSLQNDYQNIVTAVLEIANSVLKRTTKESLIQARIGQGNFRTQVLSIWGNKCAVTGSEILEAIRASHILPWSESTDLERLDPNNGLPLIANIDALFDAHLISFDASGKLIISEVFSDLEICIHGLNNRYLRIQPNQKTQEYLDIHRTKLVRR